MKRILSMVMVILMVLGALPSVVFAADPVIKVTSDKTEAAIGDTLEVKYDLTDNPGFTNTDLRLTFDPKVLRFTGLKKMTVGAMQFVDGALVTAVVNATEGSDGYGRIAYAGDEAYTDDYHLFIALFEVIGEGETTVGVEIDTFQWSEVVDGVQSWKPIAVPTVTPVTIRTTSPHSHEHTILKYDDKSHWYECECEDKSGIAEHDQDVTIPGKSATCKETGLTDGKKCSDCGKVTVEQTKAEKLAHTEETVPGKDATCKETGLTEGRKCTVCGEILEAQKVIEKAAHTEETVPGKAATCKETGLTDGKKCSVCGEVTVEQTKTEKLAHTEETIPGKPATYTETGLTDGKKCTVCGAVTLKQEVIPMLIKVEDGKAEVSGDAVKDAIQRAEESETVKIPISTTQMVGSTLIDGSSINAVVEAGKALEIETDAYTVTLDAEAIKSVNGIVAENARVEIKVNEIRKESLTEKQQEAVKEKEVAKVISMDIICDEENVTDFNGGTMTVKIPFEPKEGTKGEYYTVLYVADNGQTEEITTKYVDGCIVMALRHLSDYVIINRLADVESVTIDKKTAEIEESETVTLIADVKPESISSEFVTWASSDEKIATVENGVVTGVKAGKVTITATAGKKSASCTVIVNEKVIPVTAVTIDRASAEIAEGHSITLMATVTPLNATDKTVKWETSDRSVATVENGIVTGVSTGDAVITATAGGAKAECTVTVKEESLIPVYEIEVVFVKEEYKENQDVIAKVYLKKLLEDESTANVFGYALSFNDNSFVLKDACAENGLVDELSTISEGLIVRKLRFSEGTEIPGTVEEGLLIDTLTFKAVKDGSLDAELTEVEGDVDLDNAGVFVSVFTGDYVYAESILTKGTVSYTRESDIVENYISQIGNTVEFSDFGLMNAAKDVYGKLEDYAKEYVDNISVLEITEKYYELWKMGDVNVDGEIDSQDLSMILGTYGREVDAKNVCCDVKPDEDSEGYIDGGDLSLVIGHYGAVIR